MFKNQISSRFSVLNRQKFVFYIRDFWTALDSNPSIVFLNFYIFIFKTILLLINYCLSVRIITGKHVVNYESVLSDHFCLFKHIKLHIDPRSQFSETILIVEVLSS